MSTLHTTPEAMRARPQEWLVPTVLALLLVGPLACYTINFYWPFRYRNVQPLLEKVFASRIKIDHYHRIYFPNPGFVADGLTLRRNSAPDLPPVGSAEHLRVEGRWIDLLLFRKRVKLVKVDGLHVVIPPAGSRANKEDFPPGSSGDFTGPSAIVEQFDLSSALLDILRNDGTRYSFPIHHLLIGNLRKGQAISYDLDMQNAMPSGRILARGSFGPLVARQLANTPVHGEYTFTSVNLADVHGISGTLAATGRFNGTLADIETTAQSTTPDFAVGHGQPTPVSTTLAAAVNGLNGDIALRSIDAQTGSTTVHGQGTIAGSPATTNLDLLVTTGRAQDILRPFLHGPVPVSGDVSLSSHAFVAPAGAHRNFLQRLRMDGIFNIPGEHITNRSAEKKLSDFSLRARKIPSSSAADNSSRADVVSGFGGAVRIRRGIAFADRLTFLVPGARIALSGSFDLRNKHVHLLGDLHMENDISHATTGYKSLLLKPLAPFFKKGTAGAVVPVAITGWPKHYKIGQDVLHDK